MDENKNSFSYQWLRTWPCLKTEACGTRKWPIRQLAATDGSFTPQIYTMTTRRRREKRNSNKKKYEERILKGDLLLLPPVA